jgi:hypothetical protein
MRVGGLAELLQGRLGSTSRKVGFVTLTTMTQAHPRQNQIDRRGERPTRKQKGRMKELYNKRTT